jgi:hypothetical protein
MYPFWLRGADATVSLVFAIALCWAIGAALLLAVVLALVWSLSR